MLKCVSDREIHQTCLFLIDHWSPYASIPEQFHFCLGIRATSVGRVFGKTLLSELHTNTVRVRMSPGPKYFQNANEIISRNVVWLSPVRCGGFAGISLDAETLNRPR